MQASELWSGTEYAYVDGRPKGVETPMHASRVRVLRVFKAKADSWNERMTTYANVEFLDKEDNVIRTREVRARDIVDFWDEYQDRYQHILSERKKREEEAAARRAADIAEKERIMDYILNRFGVRPDDVSIYATTINVSFNRKDFPSES